MGFWIFMLVNCLLMPMLMIIFGKLFQKRPPRQINMIYGYRTKMSMLNMDTWEYAHKYFGRLWLRFGRVLMLLTILGMFPVIGKEDSTVGVVGGVVVAVQVIVLLVPVLWTERELRIRFGADGRRKQ